MSEALQTTTVNEAALVDEQNISAGAGDVHEGQGYGTSTYGERLVYKEKGCCVGWRDRGFAICYYVHICVMILLAIVLPAKYFGVAAPSTFDEFTPSPLPNWYTPSPLPNWYTPSPLPNWYTPSPLPNWYTPSPLPNWYTPSPLPNWYTPSPLPNWYTPSPLPNWYTPSPLPNWYTPSPLPNWLTLTPETTWNIDYDDTELDLLPIGGVIGTVIIQCIVAVLFGILW
eukprot:CAMPEP_0114683526 /NCGR_PEP_ID=MMETSP0191-20121206/57938_1 /TAXON_ID=126664 /ORGANISM="Sorites sp." /LENGTH=226 /DNA_ID=CAMNT_0001964841 /DNA_START=44 /DNA_END=721 /DNA_ORIENTATION=+